MDLERRILHRLRSVIDPETGVDVLRMRLVENLHADGSGEVSYTFRPSSFICPIAVTLAVSIKNAVAEVPGVRSQSIEINGYAMADELQGLINEEEME